MSKNPLKLKIAYLYPDFLQGYCDKANLDVFKQRAQERDIEVKIEEIRNDDRITSSRYDFYYISGSNIEGLDACNKHLRNNYTQLHIAAESSIPMLAINCGYILFGRGYQLNNSPASVSVGLLDVRTTMLQTPVSRGIVGICGFLNKNEVIAGYINSYAETTPEKDTEPFLFLNKNETEGTRYNNVIGTHITSALLGQNPYFCDYLIENCLKVKYKCNIPLAKLCDDIEWYAHNYLLETK